MNIFKQTNIGKWWGAFRNLGQYIAFYLTFINFFLIFMTWYMLVNPELQKRGIVIPLFAFLTLVAVGLVIIMILEHKFTLPSYMSYWNSQWWHHGNPLPDKLEKIQKQLNRIEKELKIKNKK